MIDLHCHSTYSDGNLAPSELVKKANSLNVKIMALTDHDNIDGVEEFRKYAIDHDITPINGIEFSARWKKYNLHILGLNIDISAQSIIDAINKNQQNRDLRANLIAEKLQASGINSAYQKAHAIAGHKFIGRPHFAQVLLNEGYVNDLQSAFDRYLGKGKSAYVDTMWEDLESIVTAIVKANGIAVIAHPYKYRLTRTKLHELIKAFKEFKGEGIEVVSGRMLKTQILELTGIAQRFELLASTGSDFHGKEKTEILPGMQEKLPETLKPVWHNFL